MLLLRQLSQVMRQASAEGGFFDAWMKHNSDLVQGAANAFAGESPGVVGSWVLFCRETAQHAGCQQGLLAALLSHA